MTSNQENEKINRRKGKVSTFEAKGTVNCKKNKEFNEGAKVTKRLINSKFVFKSWHKEKNRI